MLHACEISKRTSHEVFTVYISKPILEWHAKTKSKVVKQLNFAKAACRQHKNSTETITQQRLRKSKSVNWSKTYANDVMWTQHLHTYSAKSGNLFPINMICTTRTETNALWSGHFAFNKWFVTYSFAYKLKAFQDCKTKQYLQHAVCYSAKRWHEYFVELHDLWSLWNRTRTKKNFIYNRQERNKI